MNYVVFSVLMIVWVFFLLSNGMKNLFTMLGGSFYIFLIIPILLLLPTKYEKVNKLIWSILTSLISLIIINYLHTYFNMNHTNFKSLTAIFIVLLPIMLVVEGYRNSICFFIPLFERENFDENSKKNLLHYAAFFCYIIFFSVFCLLPYLYFHTKDSSEILLNGYLIGLGCLLVGLLVFIAQSARISLTTLNYYAKSVKRISYDFNKIKNILIIAIIIFYVFSFSLELTYRGNLILWLETYLLVSLLILFLYVFGRIVFIDRETTKPQNISLPSIKSKLNIAIFSMFILIYILYILLIFIR